MKAGLVTSVALHGLLLGLGLFTLSAPSALQVADVEAMPVDIVPIEEVTNIQQGEKTATVKEKPAPLPTKRPDIVPLAQKVGENTVDTEAPPTPEAKPMPVESAAAPPPAPEPKPQPVEKPKEVAVEKPAPKPEPIPTPEVAAVPKPPQEVKPDPVAEEIVADKSDAPAEEVQLPTAAPAPEARPPTPKAQTAQTPERKVTEQPKAVAASKPASTEKDFNADEVAALLNKQKPSGGGAKRSTEQASLGGDKSKGGAKLSQSEMDALRSQLGGCWSLPAGAADLEGLRVSVRFNLDQTGDLSGAPRIENSSGNNIFDESAMRAVRKCVPFNLPADKYDTWAEVVVNFDPSDMLF